MDRDSKNDSIREMEQIRKGLEDFLNQQVLNQEDIQQEDAEQRSTNQNGINQSSRENRRILNQQNLKILDAEVENQEAFSSDALEQGTEETHDESKTAPREPQFFTIGEEDEEEERELDIIETQSKNRSSRAKRAVEEDYVEDWDSKEHRRKVVVEEDASMKKSSQKRKQADKTKSQSRHSEKESRDEIQDTPRRSGKKRKKKKSGWKKFLITVAVLFVLLGAGLYYLVGVAYSKMNYGEITSVSTEPMKQEGVVNILLIGNDSRQNGEDGRSDAMILLSISDETNKIYMTSLLRDMYVDIPGYKGNRLNAAYSFGGAELLMETIELNFDIKVDRYVLVNFEAFANLVDAVGGVDLELTSEEIEYVNGYLVEYNMLTGRPQGTDNMDTSVSGLVHLNGPQALAYSRNRYLGTDFGRTERQRKILSAVIQQAPKSLLTNPKELMDGILPNLTTNLTQTEMFQLSLMAPKALTYEIVQSSIPIEGTYKNATIREMAVLEVDFEANKQYLKENIYGETVTAEE